MVLEHSFGNIFKNLPNVVCGDIDVIRLIASCPVKAVFGGRPFLSFFSKKHCAAVPKIYTYT
jgi:hypothetical protein